MPGRQRGWNSHEAVVLLEGLLEILNNGVPRRDVIRRVSRDLREMAKRQGENIDDTFRNENGISFQLQSMESAYKGYTISKSATKLFADVVEMYRQNRQEYDKLLGEAREMINDTHSCESDFMTWLSNKVSPAQLSELYWCYTEIESSCLSVKILKKPLFETTDYETVYAMQRYIEQNKYFHATHRRQFSKLITAGRHYLLYTKEMAARQSDSEKNGLDCVEKHEEVASVKKPVDVASNNKTEANDTTSDEKKFSIQEQETLERQLQKELEAESVRNHFGTTLVFLMRQVECTDKRKVKQILEEARWARLQYGRYYYVEEPQQETLLDEKQIDSSNKDGEIQKKAESPLVRTSEDETQGGNKDSLKEKIEQNELIIDFNNMGSFAHTKPCSFTYFEENKGPCSSWSDLYVSFFAALYEDYPHIFRPGMSFSMNKGRSELAVRDEAGFMVAPKEVPGTNLAIETNISATNIVRKMKYLLDLCSVDYENVVIKYCLRTFANVAADSVIVQPTQSAQRVAMVDRHSFYNYLLNVQNLSQATSRSYSSAIGSCETFAREHQYESWRLYTSDLSEAKATVDALFHDEDFIEYNDKWHNQLRAAIAKLLSFIGDGTENLELDAVVPRTASPKLVNDYGYRNELYEKVLKEKFKHGFRLDSSMEIRRFRKLYANTNGMELEVSDDEICDIIKRLCIIYRDRAYLPEVMLSNEMKEKLFQYIDDSFEKGAKMVYYQALCEAFAEDFLEYPLYNDSEALKEYLSSVGKGMYCINRNGISRDRNVLEDPITEIRVCLQNNGRPMSYEELYSELPHLPQEKIRQILGTNQEFINDKRGFYFHESALNLSDGELENIAQIIEQIIEEKDFVAGNELYMAIQKKYPDIIDNNSAFSELGFRDALKYKLRSRYVFTGNIISSKYKPIAMSDVFADYARNHESFTYSELELLASEINSNIYLDAVYKNSFRVSQQQFVSKSQGRFNVPETDAALDRICTGDYIAIQKVDNYGTFPYAGFPWNCFLLESYVLGYSNKYILLQASHVKKKCAGAIVKKSAGINDFDDFIVRVLSETDVELKKDSVLQFLVDEGYLATRKYTRIENLIIRAQAQRNRKEID